MDKQFLPKPLKKYQAQVYKNFSWLDIIVLASFFILVILLWVTIPIHYYFRLAISGVMLLLGFVVILPAKNEVKIYEKIFYFLVYISGKNNYTRKNSNFIFPYHSITNGLLKLKSGSLIKIVELSGFNLFLLHETDQRQRIEAFQNFILKNTGNFNIYKVNLPVDLADQKAYIQSIKARWSNHKQISKITKVSEDILNELIRRNTHVQDRYFLFINGASANELLEKYRILKQPLDMAYLSPTEILDQDHLIEILSSIYMTDIKISPSSKNDSSIITIADKISFRPTHIKVNHEYLKIFAVYALPKEAYVGWIASLSTIPGVDWMLNIKDYPQEKARKKLDRVISSLEMRTSHKASEEAATDAYLEAMHELNEKLNGQGEILKSCNIFIIAKANSKKDLDWIAKELKAHAFSSHIYVHGMMNLQKDMFHELVPSLSKGFRLTPSVEIPTMGIAYGFPFLSEDHKDKKGMYLGYSAAGRNIFFDPTWRDGKRVNSNMYIFGTSGKGKSTISKKLMKDLYLGGHRIIAIDPEREYDFLCQNVGGTWINFGTDRSSKQKNYIINPMQFLKNESDDREMLSSHMQFLEQFLRTLFPDLTLKETSILKKYITLAYKKKNIADDNSHLNFQPERYPLLSDVALLMNHDLKKENDPIQKDILTNLSIYFSVFLDHRSPESKLWNNPTNFNLYESDFIVADLQSLEESGNNRLKNAQMFILLKMVNNFMVANKLKKELHGINKFLVLVIDEAHLLVDARAPFATRFMFEVVKRGRKYNAMTIVATQSVRDFLGKNPELSDLTSGIINNCQYAFILGMMSGDISDLDESMRSSGGLTTYEKDVLAIADQGRCLFLVGTTNRKIMQIDVVDEELLIWDKQFALDYKTKGDNYAKTSKAH